MRFVKTQIMQNIFANHDFIKINSCRKANHYLNY